MHRFLLLTVFLMAAASCAPAHGKVDLNHYIQYRGYMKSDTVIDGLSALAQPTRLAVFRLLVTQEPDGMAAGEIAAALKVPQNTMSAHLNILAQAGLVSSQRYSRSIVYRAELAQLQDVILFLLQDCCEGRPEICAPVVENLTPCCPPKKKKKVNA